MSKKLSIIAAAIGPPLFMAIVACISRQVELYASSTFDAIPRLVWMICAGVLAALYLALPLIVYPKYGSRPLILGAVIGIILAILLGVIGAWGFGLSLPLNMDPLAVLAMAALCITGNIFCILRTVNLPKIS